MILSKFKKNLTIEKLVNRQITVFRGLWYLRNCNKLGTSIRMSGSAFVQNHGTINIGNRVCFHPGPIAVELTACKDALLEIGDECFINYGVSFNASELISIGKHCRFGIGAMIMDSNSHQESVQSRAHKPAPNPVILEDDVWIASRAIILPGVRLGKGCIIGAGSVVTRSIPPGMLAVGSPAKVIRPISELKSLEEIDCSDAQIAACS